MSPAIYVYVLPLYTYMHALLSAETGEGCEARQERVWIRMAGDRIGVRDGGAHFS